MVRKKRPSSKNTGVSNRYEKAKSYGRKTMILLVVVLIALVALGLSGFRFAYATMLPDVIELSEQEATDLLGKYGMEVEIQRDWSDYYEEGMVMRQNPQGGAHTSSETVVTLVVSKGPKSVIMPELSNMSREEVVELLNQSSVSWMMSTAYSDKVEAGKVVSQVPGAGEEVFPGDEVLVIISKGTEPVARTSQDVVVIQGTRKKDTNITKSSSNNDDTDSDEEDDDEVTTSTGTSTRNSDSNSYSQNTQGNTDNIDSTHSTQNTTSDNTDSSNNSTGNSNANTNDSNTADDNSLSDNNTGTGDPELDEQWSSISLEDE